MGRYVVGIGAANVDIYCKSSINIREHFDHPAKISYSPGGVTRNILENLVRLGINAKILTANFIIILVPEPLAQQTKILTINISFFL